MTVLRLFSGLALAAAVVLAPSVGETNTGGALPGFAGDPEPGEETATCAVCHASFALNSGAGGVAIDAPSAFAPGETVRITVTVDNQTAPAAGGAARQGFQAVVKDAATDEPVGTVAVVDAAATQLVGGDVYVTHTAGGTAQSAWAFDWTAPSAPPAAVRVYAAGNAANGNGGTSGDHVYTATADLAAATVATAPPVSTPAFGLSAPRPNPVRSGATVRLDLSGVAVRGGGVAVREGGVAVRVVDGRGRTVRDLGRAVAGPLAVPTAGLAAGRYAIVADGPGGRRVRPLVVR